MDQVKIAAGFGISTEKLAQDHSLFTELCKIANVDLAKVSDDQAEYLFSSLVQFEKAASASGKDLFGSDLNVVLDHYNAFLEKKAEDAKKEEDKDDDKDDNHKKASAYAQRIAAIAADEEYYAGLGKIAAAAYLSELEEYAKEAADRTPIPEKLTPEQMKSHESWRKKELKKPSANDMRQTSLPGLEPIKERAQNAAADAKDTAKAFIKSPKKTLSKGYESAKGSVSEFLKSHPNTKRNVGIAGGAALGAAGAGFAAHHLLKGREASEEKKAYDLAAAEYARDLLVQDGRFDAYKIASALQAELDKAAMEGDDVSDDVKAASAQDINLGLEERAWEFLGNLGFTRLAGTDSPDDDALRYHSDLSPVVG